MRAALVAAILEKELSRHKRGQTSGHASSRGEMAKETSRAILRTQARAYCGDAHMDLLCDARANGFDGEAMAATDNTSFGAGAVSHPESLWIVPADDARTLRQDRCAVWSGNTGSQRQPKNNHKACGGKGSNSASTLQHSNVNQTEGSPSWSGQQRWNPENEDRRIDSTADTA